jgi:hypothetical protein
MFMANAGIQIQLLNRRRNGLLRCPLDAERIISQTATREQSIPGKHPGILLRERRARAASNEPTRQSVPPHLGIILTKLSVIAGSGAGIYMFYLICPDRAVVACLRWGGARKTSCQCGSARFDAVYSNRVRDAAAIAGASPLRACCRFRAHPSTDPMSSLHPIIPAAPATELRHRGLRIKKVRALETRSKKENSYRRDNCSSRDYAQPSIAARP